MTAKMKRAMLLWLFMVLLSSMVTTSYTIPTHCPPHLHNEFTVHWELDGVPDGSTCHNHRDTCNFHPAAGSAIPSPQPYSAYACWDCRTFQVDDDDAVFKVGHGFINECFWLGGGRSEIPRYRFDANVPAVVRDRVREAFKMWDAIPSDQAWHVVGLAFVEAIGSEPEEIRIRWQDLPFPTLGETDPSVRPVTVTFDSNPSHPWNFTSTATNTPVDQYHFFSTALHEIGHVVGLDEQDDSDDVMIWQQNTGPNNPGAGQGPAFDSIDKDSVHGARDLYMIPTHQNFWQLWFIPIIGSDAQISALLGYEADVAKVERPADLATLEAEGFMLPSMHELAYSMLFENNLIYPCNDMNFRKAVNRLVDKAALTELSYPLQSSMEYWLPPTMGEWVADGGVDPQLGYRPDYPLPHFNPGMPTDTGTDSAYSYLNDGGYTMNDVPNPWYDEGSSPDWASEYLRTWPGGAGVMPLIAYTTRSPVESSLYFEYSQIICNALQQAGINVQLVPKTHLQIIHILTNEVAGDYQILSGIDLPYPFSPEPSIQYDFYKSGQFPLWNVWFYSDPDMDKYCADLKGTLDYLQLKIATMETQRILCRDEPYIPLTTKKGFWAFDSDVLGAVNMIGYGSGGARNHWTKMNIRNPEREPVVWILPTYIDNLNPLTANTDSAWQILELISGKAGEYAPYTFGYMPWALASEPTLDEWTGPNGELGSRIYFEMRQGLTWHDGVPVTAEDAVFGLNLMRFQGVERYMAVWHPIYDVVQTGTYTWEVYYLQRYYFAARQVGDICFMTPKHIWEGFIQPTIDAGAGPCGGDVWTDTVNHHSLWRGWENSLGADTYNGYPELELTELIGLGPYIHHLGGWNPGVCCILEPNRYYMAIGSGAPATYCPCDFNGDHYADGRDIWHLERRFGHESWMPIWYTPLGKEPPLTGFSVDVALPTGSIDMAEQALMMMHAGHWWGIGDPPLGWQKEPPRPW